MSHYFYRRVFVLLITVVAALLLAPQSARAAGPWYVTPGGNDNNDCLNPSTSCATIQGAIGKASAGDTINISIGTYTSTGSEVIVIDRNITLSGGWDEAFTAQSGFSTIDGQNSRRGITVYGGITANLDHLIVKNGFNYSYYGGGIYSDGDLHISNSSIHSNSIGNYCYGGGIFFNGTALSIDNTTVSNNIAGCNGGGIFSAQIPATVTINNSTISNNTGGGLFNNGTFILQNSIVAGNTIEDCNGTPFTSWGNNIIGNTANCTITATTGDQFNTDPILVGFLPTYGFNPLSLSSPAIDAGNNATCSGVDQRGVIRPQGAACDIGAYEFSSTTGPATALAIAGGNNQLGGISTAFAQPLKVAALDEQGNLVSGLTVDFIAPDSGPSGTFLDTGTNTSSVVTDASGLATASTFVANEQAGAYLVTAAAAGLGSVTFNLEQIARPANDNFANAEPIPAIPFNTTVDITNATFEFNEPPDCPYTQKTVWYSFTPTENVTIRASTFGGPIFGNVNVYLASGTGFSALNYLGCSYGGSVNFYAEAGKTYYLQVGPASSWEVGNSVQLTLEQITPPVNDLFTNAESITTLPFNTTIDITNATNQPPDEPRNCWYGPRTIWYAFTPTENMTLRADYQYGNINIFIASGPGFSGLSFLGCTYNGGSQTTFYAEMGKTYYLQVIPFATSGSTQINLAQIYPPANDTFANAELLTSLPFSTTINISDAWNEPLEPQPWCINYMQKTVWYSFTPTENMTLRADTYGSAITGNVNIYLATGSGFAGLSFLGCSNGSSINFSVEAGKTYYLQTGPANPWEFGTTIQINLQQIFPPANDAFSGAEAIAAVPSSIIVDITNAGTEPGEPQNCIYMSKTVWYAFTPTETMMVRVDTQGSAIPASLNIYQPYGPGISDQTSVGCTAWSGTTSFLAQAGQTYYIQAGNASQLDGNIQINIVQAIPPTNDSYANATLISALPFSAIVNTSDATNESGEPQGCYYMNKTVWYAFTPTETMKVRADTLGSSISGNVNIYRSTGSTISDLQFMQCAGPGSVTSFIAEAGKTYYLQAGPAYNETGTIQVNLTEVPSIKGRITDAVTGVPLPSAYVVLQRNCGGGCYEYVNAKYTDGDGRFLFDSYYYGAQLSNGSYRVQVSANMHLTTQFGPIDFNGINLDIGDVPLSPPSVIRGRAVDAKSGVPMPGTLVTLRRCDVNGCNEYIQWQTTNSLGQFQFNSNYYGEALRGGTYQLEFSAPIHEVKHVDVVISDGEDRNLGDIAITPFPVIGSIRGRLIDAATGKSIASDFAPTLQLWRCYNGSCYEYVNSTVPDSAGYFRFEMDYNGNRLIVGTYQIIAYADQYQSAQTFAYTVENADHDVSNLRITSNPVRFSQVQPCTEIPSSGGDCIYSVRIWNGLSTQLGGATWSLVNGYLPSFAGYTNFQIKDPQDIDLGAGKSKVFQFHFSVPANNSTYGTFLCANVLVGQGGSPYFNTVGYQSLFCVLRNASGYSIATLQEIQAFEPAAITTVTVATGTDTEPNNACQVAQNFGEVQFPFVLNGMLDSSQGPDVDFFRFTGTPNALVTIDLEGQGTNKGTLSDPFLGYFDSNCTLIATNDDSGGFLNSRLEITIPADGTFVLAASRCCDYAFFGGGYGSYQLAITPVQTIGSITGRVTDAVSKKVLQGNVAPYAFVSLLQCSQFGCSTVNSQTAGADGRFTFTTNSYGAPLRTGSYMVVASADQYQTGQTQQFAVGSGENHDIGDLALTSFPVRFGDVQPCTIDSGGGVCQFSVKITNGLPTKLSGKAWSIIDGYGIGSFINSTSFQAASQQDVLLDAGKSTILRFNFRVPSGVADGASICTVVYVGQGRNALFDTVGQRYLFCLIKGSNGYTLSSTQETQTLSRRMQIQENILPHPAQIKKNTP